MINIFQIKHNHKKVFNISKNRVNNQNKFNIIKLKNNPKKLTLQIKLNKLIMKNHLNTQKISNKYQLQVNTIQNFIILMIIKSI